jgi:membrane associated rhomboid family serine protease
MQRPAPPNNAPAPDTAVSSQSAMFVGTPTSKLICLATVLLYVFLHSQKALSLTSFDSSRIRTDGQVYRYLTSQWCFSSPGELVMGSLLLLYWMRPLEREMGTRKYALFALVIIPLVAAAGEWIALRFITIILDTPSAVSWQYSGPYPLLGAHFAWFHLYVPRLYPRFTQLVGFTFSEKSIIYLWCLQVATAGRWGTVAAMAMGVVAWIIYFYFLMNRLSVPNMVVKTISSALSGWVGPWPVVTGAAATRGVAPRHAAAAAAAGALRPVVALTPDPAAIDQLTAMGFARGQVVEALRATNNHVERAADRLLSQHS